MKVLKKLSKGLLIAAIWIGVWYGIWALIGLSLLFPSPHDVAKRLFELLGEKSFYLITLKSLWNILKGLLIGVAAGCLLAALSALSPWFGDLIRPLMTVVKATPVASFIILLFIFIGAAKIPSLVTVLIVLPLVWGNLDEGLKKIDPKLREVTKVYRFPFLKRMKILVFPSLLPYFSASLKSALGLAWKAGVAAEIIARPIGTIGSKISTAKSELETTDVFAWTLTVILLSFLIEFALTKLLDRVFSKKREVHHAAV